MKQNKKIEKATKEILKERESHFKALADYDRQPKEQKTEEWEKEFGQLVSKAWKNGLWHSESELHTSLKSFIRRLLIEEKTKWLEELKKTRI